jgi:molybdopterin molybdotransferase
MKTLDQIAATLQGYDPNAMAVSAVHDFISKLVTAVQELQDTPLMETLGKVLASDVVSPFDVPPHDNSAMDGYAFDGKQLPTAANAADLSLAVVGTALAGAAWVGSAGPGQCVRIMTGAIMPPGCDTVVPQELVHLVNDRIRFSAHAVRPGDNRRLRGEDLTQGQPALQKGERITPARLGLAASLGLKTLPCWRPLRVAYFSTGDEILSLGEPAREGAVYDSNRYTVFECSAAWTAP